MENSSVACVKILNFLLIVSYFISANEGYYKNPDSSDCENLNTQAFIIIIYGYLELAKCATFCRVLLLLVPLLCYYSRNGQQHPQWIPAPPEFMQGLFKQRFNEFERQHQELSDEDKKCSICFLEYGENDEITPLPCDDRHFFHTQCIEDWLKANNSCPICRKPINQEAIKE